MADNTNNQTVDGFSDNLSSPEAPEVDAADKGVSGKAPKPLSPEEYEKAKQDAREAKPTDGHPEAARENS